jgi:hypothetical protein
VQNDRLEARMKKSLPLLMALGLMRRGHVKGRVGVVGTDDLFTSIKVLVVMDDGGPCTFRQRIKAAPHLVYLEQRLDKRN